MRREDIPRLIAALCTGDEGAFHTLIEAPDDIVPRLTQEFHSQADGELRARLVEAIWRHRLPSTIPFLATALTDEHAEVWKQALDGLVTIGGDSAKETLHACKRALDTTDERNAWINEALDQLG
jgi:HEAT repeat protein